jgi:hypothetical protein
VARHDLVRPDKHRAAIQRLPPEHAAERAWQAQQQPRSALITSHDGNSTHEQARARRTIVLAPDFLDDFVHGPPVQLLVRHDLERNLVLALIPLDSLPESDA